jgi:plasmid stabilization system protein ParE
MASEAERAVKQVPFSADGRDDLAEILDYFGQIPDGPANRILDSLEETFQSILTHPYLGAAHSELTRLLGEEIRSRLVASYRIYYRLGRSGSEIISILHGARDQRNVLTSRFTQ